MAWLVEERALSFRPFWCLRSSLVRLAACRSPSPSASFSPRRPTPSSILLSHAPRIAYDDTCTRSFHVHTRARERALLFPSLSFSPYSFPPSPRPLFSLPLSLLPSLRPSLSLSLFLPKFQSVLLARPPPLVAPFLSSLSVCLVRASASALTPTHAKLTTRERERERENSLTLAACVLCSRDSFLR